MFNAKQKTLILLALTKSRADYDQLGDQLEALLCLADSDDALYNEVMKSMRNLSDTIKEIDQIIRIIKNLTPLKE